MLRLTVNPLPNDLEAGELNDSVFSYLSPQMILWIESRNSAE